MSVWRLVCSGMSGLAVHCVGNVVLLRHLQTLMMQNWTA